MFPNRGQLTANSDHWGVSPPIGAYSIRYRQVQENFAKELEERKKEEKKRISERFRFNAEETLRRQKDTRDKRKAFEAAEEKHRKEILSQRKLQQRQSLSQAKVTGHKKNLKSFKTTYPGNIDQQQQQQTKEPPVVGSVKRASSFQSQKSQLQTNSKLLSYDSEPNLNVLQRSFPPNIGQGRIVLAVDQNIESRVEESERSDENRSSMSSALEQLIDELKQPNLDIERFTKQMSTTQFSAKSNKYSSNYIHSDSVKLFPEYKPIKPVTEQNNTQQIAPPTNITSRNSWIAPAVESHREPFLPQTLATVQPNTTPLMHKLPSEPLTISHSILLSDSLDVDTNTLISGEVSPGDIIRVVSVESDSTSSNSPPLSPTMEHEYAIDLQDSLEEPRIPTPPLPDLVPSLPPSETNTSNNQDSAKLKEIKTEDNRWNWVGLADNFKKQESTTIVTQNVESQAQEVEVPPPTKLVGILKSSKSHGISHSVRSKRRVRFAGAEYMNITQNTPVSTPYLHGTFPYRVSTPSKGNNLNSFSVIGESKSLFSLDNPTTLQKNIPQQQEIELSLDSTPTDVDIHLIWNQIRENLRKSNSVVNSKKYFNSDSVTQTHKPVTRMLSKRHPRINRVTIAPKSSDSDFVAWSEQPKEHQPSQLSIEESKVLASLARLDTQIEAKQAYLRTMRSPKQTKSPNYSSYKNR